jgi:G3E family GTPase
MLGRRLLLNKIDLLPEGALEKVVAGARAINSAAQIHECSRSAAPLSAILHQVRWTPSLSRLPLTSLQRARLRSPQRAFELERAVERHPVLATPPADAEDGAVVGVPSFLPPSRQLGTLCIEAAELDLDAFNRWVAELLKVRGEQLLRMKGILAMRGHGRRFVFHTVHMIFEGAPGSEWGADEARRSKIVMIGLGLPKQELRRGFAACAAPSDGGAHVKLVR